MSRTITLTEEQLAVVVPKAKPLIDKQALKKLLQSKPTKPVLKTLPVVSVRCNRRLMRWEIKEDGKRVRLLQQAILRAVTFTATLSKHVKVQVCGVDRDGFVGFAQGTLLPARVPKSLAGEVHGLMFHKATGEFYTEGGRYVKQAQFLILGRGCKGTVIFTLKP